MTRHQHAARLLPALFLIAGGILLGGCSNRGGTDSERERLLATDQAFSDMSAEHGPATAFHAYLTDNALQLPHMQSPLRGRDAIRDAMQGSPPFELTWEPQDANVAQSGDVGWTWGFYTAVFNTANGEEITSNGKYLNVWEKQPDGSWKVAIDMGNQSPNLPADDPVTNEPD